MSSKTVSTKSAMAVPTGRILDSIFDLRGKRVIMDSELAKFYGVQVKRLNETVRRNAEKFPEEFSFLLKREEVANLKSQFATSSSHGGVRKPPRAFTVLGAIMAAMLLNSPQAVKMSVFIVRAFVKMREALAGHRELAVKLAELERTLTSRMDGHEQTILELVDAMKQLMEPPASPKREAIGFRETRARHAVTRGVRRSARK